MFVGDADEAINFVNFVMDRETKLRTDLYNQIDVLLANISCLKAEKRKIENTNFKFVRRYGDTLSFPPIDPLFAAACTDFDAANEKFSSNTIVFAAPVVNVIFAERVSKRYTSPKGFFVKNEMLNIVQHEAALAAGIGFSGTIAGARISFCDDAMIIDPIIEFAGEGQK